MLLCVFDLLLVLRIRTKPNEAAFQFYVGKSCTSLFLLVYLFLKKIRLLSNSERKLTWVVATLRRGSSPSETTVCILCSNSVVMHLLTQHMRKPLVLRRGRGQEQAKTLKWLPPKYVGHVHLFVVSGEEFSKLQND